MNLAQMQTFQAVMTSASLSDAAKKLGRTQPAVSAAVKALEDQLGLKLFERKGRKLIPVPEAQYLLAEANEILSQVSRVRQTMQSLSDGHGGTLKVAAMPGPVSMIFPKFIASKLSGSGDVSVSIQARTSNQIAELTRAQSIDFGFADAPKENAGENLYKAVHISADCPVALPGAHPLARQTEIRFAELDGLPLGTLPAVHRQSVDLANRFAAEGGVFNAMIESQTFLPIMHFVSAGQCASVIDPLSIFLVTGAASMVPGIAVRPMVDPIRYHYAIYSPGYRPISVIAATLLQAWQDEVMTLLEEAGFHPRLEGQKAPDPSV